MASNTSNLGLLKKDPLTDGKDTFNIRTMLNDNWDKIDEFAGKTIPISRGGTGATTAEQALANLGGIALGAVGNLHVWERVQTYSEEVPAGYTLGPSKQIELIKGKNNSGSSISYRTITVSYSSSISVSENGDNITLNSPSTVNLRPDYPAEGVVLRGKFIQVTQWDSTYVDTVSGVLFIQSDASFADDYPNSLGWHSLTCSSAQVVTGTPAIPAGTTTDYLTSTDRNAYPDNVTDAQDAYYTLGDVVTGTFRINAVSNGTTIYYASSVNVADDGTVTLANQSSYSLFADEDSYNKAKNLAGKFIIADASHAYCKIPKGVVLFIPADTTISFRQDVPGDAGYGIFFDRYQPVTGHAAIPANTTITYLGQLGGGARIEVGSYVGTGTYGERNPNTITFDFAPKLVWIIGPGNGSFNVTNTPVLLIYDRTFYYNSDIYNTAGVLDLSVTWGDKFVSYYYKSGFNGHEADAQLNDGGKTYSYIAIG